MIAIIIKKSESVIIFLFIVAFIIIALFVYNNVYKASFQVEEIAILNQKVSPVSLRKGLWNKVKTRIDKKIIKYTLPEVIRDPFNF